MIKYVVYDLEPNDNPIFAVCDSLEEAVKKQECLAQEFAEELFNADPKETGIDKNDPCERQKVLNDCQNTIGIQTVEEETKKAAYFIVYTHKGVYDFDQLCNRVEYDKSPNYCKFINTNEDGDTLLALIPHSEIRGIERIEC